MSNISGINPKRLTKEQLLFELTNRNIKANEIAKRGELIKELEIALANIIKQKGDIDKSKRFTAASMLECLKSKVEDRELKENEILKLQTIQ
ncbi:6858_t:CDS:2, partial [Gigaspora margarita]